MISRKDKLKKDNAKRTKLLIGTLFLTVGIGSSVNVAFADQDIQGMLTGWFDKQKTKSIETIEKAVMSEKEIQMQRLKEELQLEIKNTEIELNQFTEEEKNQRVENIRKYTDELVKNIDIDNSKEKAKVIEKLEKITLDAVAQLEKEAGKKKPNEQGLVAEKENTTPISEPTSDSLNEEVVNDGGEQ